MTRAARRDGRSIRASVIPGIRLEADTAKLLVDAACQLAPAEAKKANTACGDVGATVRHLVRVGLGIRVHATKVSACGIAGLHLDIATCEALTAFADENGFTKAGAVRHFIRLGVGMSDEMSRERESYFAELREKHEGTRLDGAARFR